MFYNTRLRYLPLLVLLLSVNAPVAHAKSDNAQKSLGSFGQWEAFSFRENEQPVCYMALTIPAPKGKKPGRGEGRLTLTQRPSDGSKDVISYTAGYTFKSGSNATIEINKGSYDLFTVKNTAWARDAATDRAIARALRSNRALAIIGQPTKRGSAPVKEVADITGAPSAYQAINQACGIETAALPAPPAKLKGKKKPHKQ